MWKNIFENEILSFILILFLNILSGLIGTIKTIFVSKKAGKATLIITFFDAAVYSTILKAFVSSGHGAIIAYILGRVIGAWLGDLIENKIALGVNEITLYIKEKDKMDALQKVFLEKGFSSTANVSYLTEDINRYFLTIQISRKDMKDFYKILKENGINRPTMTIREIQTVFGRIKDRI